MLKNPPRADLPRDRDVRRDDRRGWVRRDNDRRNDRRDRGGHGTVHWNTKDKGRPCCTDIITHAIVVVLILPVRIVYAWYPYAHPPMSSQR